MIENFQIRENARHHLDNRLFGTVWVRTLLVTLLGALIAAFPSILGSVLPLPPAVMAILGFFLALGSIVLSGPIEYALARIYIKLTHGDKKVDYHDLFCGFKENFIESILLNLLKGIFIFLWALLLIVPGIIKAYSYSMSSYIQQEAEDKTWRNCLDRSQELTYGYKGKLFLLDLSFIGWYLLGLLCLGVGVLWVSVYHTAARAEFYEQLKQIKGVDFTRDRSSEPFRTDGADEDLFFPQEDASAKTPADPFVELQSPADSEPDASAEPFAELQSPADPEEKSDDPSDK